jgi:hypothetical protein
MFDEASILLIHTNRNTDASHRIHSNGYANPRYWWQYVKQLSGSINSKQSDCFANLTRNDNQVEPELLSEVVNDFFVSVSSNIPSLDPNALDNLRDNLGEVPDCFIVSEYSVYNALKHLKINKSSNDDLLSNRLLVELADVLAAPVCALINSSIQQGYVPDQWKNARITAIPKVNPPLSIEHDLRPISVTSGISKIAESFMCKFFNIHFDNFIDPNQFGCTSNRSTTHALIKLTDLFFSASDNSNNIIRILFIDFSKAFDLVNHNVLLKKLLIYDFPIHIVTWSMSFLQQRTQFVHLMNNNSNSRVLQAGTPQGTCSGPNDFKLIINDLSFDIDYVKYVDDVTTASVSVDPYDSALKTASDHLSLWCKENGMILNIQKTKEMLIHFGKKLSKESIPQLLIHSKPIERVDTFKLLGVIISSDLSWGPHISYLLGKISKRYYIIFQLARIGIPQHEIVLIYCTIIRSVLEYACPVWHAGLTSAQAEDLERVQKRCLRIIYPELSYSDALLISGLDRLSDRRENIVRNLFREIQQPSHVLYNLLPLRPTHSTDIRDKYLYKLPVARTKRYSTSFIPYCIRKRY